MSRFLGVYLLGGYYGGRNLRFEGLPEQKPDFTNILLRIYEQEDILAAQDVKSDFPSRRLFMNPASENATDQHRGENDEKHARFLRWALNSPTEEFTSVPFSLEETQENSQSPWGHGIRRSAAMLMNAAPPPLDKIDGRYVTRELLEPDFESQDDSLTRKALTNRRFALEPEFMPSHNALKHFRRKRSVLKVIPGRSTDVKLVKRLDKIDHGEWPFSSQRSKKDGFGSSKKISGSGFDSWETRNIDDSDQYGYSDLEKRNFDEIDRAGFHSLGRRNFYETDRSGFHSLGRRNFDEIDRTGLYRLGKRNFDEIDRSGFHSLGKRNFDEIDRAGFHSLGRRNFDEIDRAGFHSLGRRNFDEIDRSGFINLGKRNFDEIDRSGFINLGKRNFDEIDKSGFHSLGRRNFDEIDKSAFRGFGKRDFDEIDRSGFRSFGKRNFDEIDRSGFRVLGKRNFEHLASFGDNSKDSGEAYKVENKESQKRSSDESDKAPLRSFRKRSTTEEKSKIST